jgi:hypothetical protein
MWHKQFRGKKTLHQKKVFGEGQTCRFFHFEDVYGLFSASRESHLLASEALRSSRGWHHREIQYRDAIN